MGAVHFDMEKGGRNKSAKYALNTADGIKLLLADIPYLEERRFDGDYDACDILMDFETAIEKAENHKYHPLTERQYMAMTMLYTEGYTNEEIGGIFGVSFQNVNTLANKGINKLTEVFSQWQYNEI